MGFDVSGAIVKKNYGFVVCGAVFVLWMAFMFFREDMKSEVYAVYEAQPVVEGVAEFRGRESGLAGMGFDVSYRNLNGELKRIWVSKMHFFDFRTSNSIMILNVRGGRIVGKGIRVLEGNYSLCDAPPDAGEMEATEALADGRLCI